MLVLLADLQQFIQVGTSVSAIKTHFQTFPIQNISDNIRQWSIKGKLYDRLTFITRKPSSQIAQECHSKLYSAKTRNMPKGGVSTGLFWSLPMSASSLFKIKKVSVIKTTKNIKCWSHISEFSASCWSLKYLVHCIGFWPLTVLYKYIHIIGKSLLWTTYVTSLCLDKSKRQKIHYQCFICACFMAPAFHGVLE